MMVNGKWQPDPLPWATRRLVRKLYRSGYRVGELASRFRKHKSAICLAVRDLPKHVGGFGSDSERARRAGLMRLMSPEERGRAERWDFRYFPPACDRGIGRWRCWCTDQGVVNLEPQCSKCGHIPMWAQKAS